MTARSTPQRLSPLDAIAWQLRARKQAARIRELKAGIAQAGDALLVAIDEIRQLRLEVAALKGITAPDNDQDGHEERPN